MSYIIQYVTNWEMDIMADEYTVNSDRSFGNRDEAVAFAELLENAELIGWSVRPNLPGALPEFVHNSLSLDIWDGTTWRPINIFGG